MAASLLLGRVCTDVLARQSAAARQMLPQASLLFARGKKQAKKQTKSKKDLRKEIMKEFMKKQEAEKLLQMATLKAAKKGDPLDPEMLNPARRRKAAVLTPAEREERFLLVKEWSRYCMERHKQDLQYLYGLLASRNRALRELKNTSPDLYQQALELNPVLFPFECQGPTETPPLPGYKPPDPES